MSIAEKKSLEEKKLLVRLPKDLHRKAKLMSYELNISMAQLCREGLEQVIDNHYKNGFDKQNAHE